jgi:predicted Zn-dependent protease
MRSILTLVLISATAMACSVNPVTGAKEFMIVPSSADIQVGEQNYFPLQQSQGAEYAVDPELTAYVQRVGNGLATQSGVDLPYEFVVLNNSVPNAWALPGGKIAINRGLLTELNSESELAAVLGHEVVHAAARHGARQQSRGMILQGLVIATAIATSDSDYGNLAVGGAGIGAQLITLKYGRDAELESDYYGMQYMSQAGYDPKGAVELQETFVRLSEDRSTDWLSGLFSSHPPSRSRVRANKSTAATLPEQGVLGRDAYQAVTQNLIAAKPAYDAYDAGRKALAEKRIDEALAHASTALKLFPKEAHFHALRGDVRFVADKHDMAITNYSRAIRRNDQFFYYHLRRGLANKAIGNMDSARSDLQHSIALLPTAPAHLALGEMAHSSGNVTEAISHYKIIAKDTGAYGEAATDKLTRLDLSSNPKSYILRRCDADREGKLVVLVKNDTHLQVVGVRVAVQFTTSDGALRQRQFDLPDRLGPGQVSRVNTGMGPFNPAASCPVEVIAAQIDQ